MSDQSLRPGHEALVAEITRRLEVLWGRFRRSEFAPIVVLGVVALIAHAVNMFNYPSFTLKDDEGIYASQAWAVLRLNRLSPYTYFYDHAPAGWILIAGWMGITGGADTFGGAIDSGRVLMLILHLGCVPLLFQIARKMGCRVPYAAFAVLLFSLSPLAIFNQRLLLLDNIMIFWLLLGLNLLLDGWGRLSRVALAGTCFGMAVLTKETALFLIPAVLFIALNQRWRHQGRFALAGWVVPMAAVISFYPLYALLKGELLPAGSAASFAIFTGGNSGVSLTEALQWQAGRGGGGMFSFDNSFWTLLRTEWLPMDPIMIVGGSIATVANLIRGVRGNRLALAAGLLAALPFFYLARGGVVFSYYIIFAIPFLCLNIAVFGSSLRLGPFRWPHPSWAPAVVGFALIVFYTQLGALQPLYAQQPSEAGRQALSWIKENVPSGSYIISRDDLWTDLREPGHGTPAFPNVHSHWKVAGDPDIRQGVFDNDWRKVDYLIMSPGLKAVFESTDNQVALGALQNSVLIKRWKADYSLLELRKVNHAGVFEEAMLDRSASFMERHFEKRGAYVGRNQTVFSESQAYAMLRAVWSGDRSSFYRAWTWTRKRLLQRSGLPAWLWRNGKVVDRHSATDADTDMALALLFAGKRFDDQRLIGAGRRMVKAIWRHEVAGVRGRPYITAGDWATRGPLVALNPSYFSPYAYRLFADVDKWHNWMGVIHSGYRVLFAASRAPFGGHKAAGLPPDWVALRRSTAKLTPLRLTHRRTTNYGHDAARTYWRVALDLRWSGDGRARAYLKQAGFLRDEVRRKGRVSSVYAHGGRIVEKSSSAVGNAGALSALLTLDPKLAHKLYVTEVAGRARKTGPHVHWGRSSDLYAQEWGWFATALYADQLTNIWYLPDVPPKEERTTHEP